MQDLVPIIEALSRAEPSVTDPPLTPPSLQKLERNSLSSDAAVLLQMGRRKSDLVRTFFARGSRPDLGEHIAQAFREHYQTLKSLGLSADSIFRSLQEYAGGPCSTLERSSWSRFKRHRLAVRPDFGVQTVWLWST